MDQKVIQGIYAAVLTPRLPDGNVDVAALTALLRFLQEHGIDRFALNGATGEFCLSTPAHLNVLLKTVRSVCGEGAEMLCGVGAASLVQVNVLAGIAEQAGVNGLLLPMPYFFPYQQQDLAAFSQCVANGVKLPVLLYNLPQFTTGLTGETVCSLIGSVPNIVGIKDSSGSLDILRLLTERIPAARRIVGNDSALAPALTEGICDGVVSGVACVLPELIQALYAQERDSALFTTYTNALKKFIEKLEAFPTPWGLKWVAEARGIIAADFAQPVSLERHSQGEILKRWAREWLPSWEQAVRTE